MHDRQSRHNVAVDEAKRTADGLEELCAFLVFRVQYQFESEQRLPSVWLLHLPMPRSRYEYETQRALCAEQMLQEGGARLGAKLRGTRR